jgi:hypothetical protein
VWNEPKDPSDIVGAWGVSKGICAGHRDMLLRRSAEALGVGCEDAGNPTPASGKAGSKRAIGSSSGQRVPRNAATSSASNKPRGPALGFSVANRSAALGAPPQSTARESAGTSEATRPTWETAGPTESGQTRTRAGGRR